MLGSTTSSRSQCSLDRAVSKQKRPDLLIVLTCTKQKSTMLVSTLEEGVLFLDFYIYLAIRNFSLVTRKPLFH